MRMSILIGALAFLLVGCAHTYTFENVRLGMSKDEVVQTAGHPKGLISSDKVGDKLVEVFEYRKGNIWSGDDSYWFFFANNRLQRWGRPYDHYYLD